MLDKNKAYFYVGTYTNMTWSRGKKGEGIYLIEFDPCDGAMKILNCSEGPDNPSYLAFDASCSHLYAANEIQPSGDKSFGYATSYKINKNDGSLEMLSSVSTKGISPCYIALDKQNKYAYVSNYSSGSIVSLPVNADKSLGDVIQLMQHEGTGPDKQRQERTHAHSVLLDNDEKYLFAADLGIDAVVIYSLTERDGRIVMETAGAAKVDPGMGPRHMALSASGDVLYALCEMGSRIYAFDYDGKGNLARKQDISTIPEGGSAEGNNCADIHISGDGRYLYASNRGHDSVAVYEILPGGALKFIYAQPTFGKTPRNFAIDPSGKFILAANQDSDNIVSFFIDGNTGKLSRAAEIEVPSPICVKFANI